MLRLDVARICADKGISNPKKFLLGLGLYPNAATDLLKGKRVRLDYEQVEMLCMELRCTPNDLFSWQPPAGNQTDKNHPMYSLVRQPKTSLPDLLRALSVEQIDEMRKLLEDKAARG